MAEISFKVISATQEHAAKLAPWIRAEDVEEIRAASGSTPEEALEFALKHSTIARTLILGDEVAAMFGVAPISAMTGVAAVWMLAGELVNEVPYAFMRISKAQAKELLALWPILLNAIDARYTKALRWAKWLGAEIHDAIPYGKSGMPFHLVVLRSAHV